MPSDTLRRAIASLAAIVATVVVALIVTLLWLRSIAGFSTPSIPGVPFSLGACRPASTSTGFTGDPMLLGADVGASARLGDGRLVWAYGDTFRRPDGVTLTAVRNSLVIEDGTCRAVAIPAGGQEAIPGRADGVGYWPMSVAVTDDGATSTVHVFAERVRGSERRFEFVNLGPAVATLIVPDGGAPHLVSVVDLGADDDSRRNVGWGAALASGADGYWYVYGTANPQQAMVFGWSVRVARTQADRLTEPSSWEYWDGRSWVADGDRAVEVIGAVGGVSQTFSVVEHDATWYAVSKLDGDLGTDLAVWSAPNPWGPFSPPTSVGRIPNEEHPSLLRYMPLAHPELGWSATDPAVLDQSDLLGRPFSIVVSICRNTVDPGLLLAAPELYRPYFVSIPLPPQHSGALLDAGD